MTKFKVDEIVFIPSLAEEGVVIGMYTDMYGTDYAVRVYNYGVEIFCAYEMEKINVPNL